ncbi:MAG: hypothetical protein QNJ84_19420 [Alphaproteobacteria bacterium]|nr:hypothetical protein [Alphaproteobacteria bacterium]
MYDTAKKLRLGAFAAGASTALVIPHLWAFAPFGKTVGSPQDLSIIAGVGAVAALISWALLRAARRVSGTKSPLEFACASLYGMYAIQALTIVVCLQGC